MDEKQWYNSVQTRSKISSSAGLLSKFILCLLSFVLLIIFFNKFDFSLMAFTTLIICLAVFFYLFVVLFYDPNVFYDERYLCFKKFYQPGEVISLKQIVRLGQNAHAKGGVPGNSSYRIDYINTDGRSKAINFYSEESQEIDIKELIIYIRRVNPHFITDWTLPKKLQ